MNINLIFATSTSIFNSGLVLSINYKSPEFFYGLLIAETYSHVNWISKHICMGILLLLLFLELIIKINDKS